MQPSEQSRSDRRYLRSFVAITTVLLGLALSTTGGAQQQASDQASTGGTAASTTQNQSPKQEQTPSQSKDQNQPNGKVTKKDQSNVSTVPVPQVTSPSVPYDSGTVIKVHTRLVTLDVVATDSK